MVDRRLLAPATGLPALVTGKIKFCKSIPNGVKRVKSIKPTTLNFCQSPRLFTFRECYHSCEPSAF